VIAFEELNTERDVGALDARLLHQAIGIDWRAHLDVIVEVQNTSRERCLRGGRSLARRAPSLRG
jgi:hypothetical protein